MPKTKQKHNVGEKPGNVVIRLSDLGIFDRTPEQVDLQIQAQRIFRILDDTIEKLKISFAKKLDTLVDPRMAHVLELLWNNDAVKEKCSQNYNMLVDDNAKTLVSCVKNLRRIAQMKLPQTASEQRSRETNLKNAWEENKRMKEEITGIGILLNIKLIIAASVQHYTTVLAEHMLNEKKLRSNRLKIETQLISWLNKFDDDMQERQQQYDDIKAAYDADKIEMENLKALFDVQEKEYVIAMEEKAEEEARLTELMVQNFLRNHAARIIQKCWRLYRRRKLERPKKKKGKGKR
ncbi:hypothetical protein RN001_013203 [Aquatica leii]|uniref:Dynein regulatory complex protein 10 n=1 Tax=Aquatica leii TaxID=1421715 RepID=A0AAN7QCY1_9COLE|nr:hypothetical protein RN001_013203 [Aquatica leii]